MSIKRVDPAWAIFEKELKDAKPAALANELGCSAIDITEMKAGRRRPSFAELPLISAFLYDGDAVLLATKMRIIPDSSKLFADIIEESAELHRLRERLTQLRATAADSVDEALTTLVAQVVREGEWAIAIWPGVEGGEGRRIHYRDRIDIRRTDGRPLKAGDVRHSLGQYLDLAGAEFGTAQPRWDTSRGPTATKRGDVTHWVVPRLARETFPSNPISGNEIVSVTVLSTTATARPEAVGALLARVLGYGFTSAAILTRRVGGSGVDEEVLNKRGRIHREWVEAPRKRFVWSQFGRETPDRKMLRIDELADSRTNVTIWLFEVDGVLNQKSGVNPRSESTLTDMANSRDENDSIVSARATRNLIRLAVHPVAAKPNSAQANDQNMDRSLKLAARALSTMVQRKLVGEKQLRSRLLSMKQAGSESRTIADYVERAIWG